MPALMLASRVARRVRSLQASGLAAVLSGGVRVLERASPHHALALREQTRMRRRLDYARQDIFLEIESSLEYDVRLHSCRKEPETVEWLERHLQDRDVLFDVGANVGVYALIAAKHRPAAHVYAFEPAFTNYTQLCRNVLLNGCEANVIPMPFALSSATGLQSFHYSDLEGFAAGGALHSVGAAIDEHGRPFTPAGRHAVVSYRLDDLLSNLALPTPSLLKLDTDGHELSVLEGAVETLRNGCLRTILVELHEQLENTSQVVERLSGSGFIERSRHCAGRGTYNAVFER